ncbi:MAG TPA: MFS transporter, partial [Solirubrobacteraceae bacterium]|nr:MFS transporter [Solirubrobacteraceae bacterium]
TALLPEFVTRTLGASAAVLGAIEGVSDGLAGAARFAGGALADDPERRRRTAVGGYATTAALSGLIGAASSIAQVAVLRAGAWAARGLRVPARNALLADVVAPTAYGRAYGFERAMDNLGAIVGPLLALVLIAITDVRTAILLSIIPGMVAVAAIVYAIRRTAVARRAERRPLRIVVRPVLQGPLRRLFVSIGLFEIGNIAATLLILRATDVLRDDHGSNDAAQIAIALYVLYNIAATLISLPGGRQIDRTGPTRTLTAGIAAFALAYLLFAVTSPSIPLLAVAFIAAGIGIGCVETAEHTAVATFAPDHIRGSAFGLLAATQSFGNVVASALAGVLYAAVSPAAAFAFAAVCMLAALGTFVRRSATPTTVVS